MFDLGIVFIITGIFLAMVLNLAANPSFNRRITVFFLIVTIIGGNILYGFSFLEIIPDSFVACIRTLLAVCGMFMGKNEFSAIASSPIMQYEFSIFFFWFLHLAAIYTTASAAITTVGAEALKTVRLMLAQRGQLTLIYGTNEQAIALGEECNKEKNMSVVFVDGSCGDAAIAQIKATKAAFRLGRKVLNPDHSFLRSLGIRPGMRKIHVYCMKDELSNYQFASRLKDALEKARVKTDQLTLTMLGREDSVNDKLQALGDRYGYGDVFLFHKQDQAARLMIKKCPPWKKMHFDENGKAMENFECLIIGFGSYGQGVLKALVENGQFTGSHFKATIISDHCHSRAGLMELKYQEFFKHYDIELVEGDGRSIETFKFLNKNKNNLKYIAVCINSDKISKDVAGQIKNYLNHLRVDIPISQCSVNGIRWYEDRKTLKEEKIMTRDTLNVDQMDRMAMAINHRYYMDMGHTLKEDWENCDYFSRMSCRAAASFIPAMLKMLHMTEEEAKAFEEIELTEEQAQILGECEHERWNAFHYCRGFLPMPLEMWEERAKIYQEQKQNGEKNLIRIGKDMEMRYHACIVGWDELDELSARENAVTGGNVNYKEYDIENVRVIPTVLKLSEI